MIKFNKCKLNKNILDQWVNAEVNVLLIGEKGVGKTFQILETFKRNNLKYAYFSGATLDPWIHLLGIPKAKLQDDGTEKMEFILPENLDNDVEAIFCDEWNRCSKLVRNALLELQQFKSINGRKFPKLKLVWGAVNPPDSEEYEYDVDELDPAQLDRFHVIVELPNEPDSGYFNSIFGEYHGKILVDWWEEQSKESKKILSPRRLEYIGNAFKKGLDIKFLLPVSANYQKLVGALSIDDETHEVNKILNGSDDGKIIEFVKDDTKFLKYKKQLQTPKLLKFWKYANEEFVTNSIKTEENFQNFALYELYNGDVFYKKCIKRILEANPKHELFGILSSLKENPYIPEESLDIDQLVGKDIKIPQVPYDKGNRTLTEIDESRYKDFRFSADDEACFVSNTTMNELYSRVYSIKNKMLIIATTTSLLKQHTPDIHNYDKSSLVELIGTTCIYAKQYLNSHELGVFTKILQRNIFKISEVKMNNFVKYLTSVDNSNNIDVPLDFLKKIKSIRMSLKK